MNKKPEQYLCWDTKQGYLICDNAGRPIYAHRGYDRDGLIWEEITPHEQFTLQV